MRVQEKQEEEILQTVNDKYGVALRDLSDGTMTNQFRDVLTANQVRGSINKPNVIQGVDTETVEADEATPGSTQDVKMALGTETIVPLLMRFKLIRLVTRCVDYIMNNRPLIGEEGARRRRNMLVKLLGKRSYHRTVLAT